MKYRKKPVAIEAFKWTGGKMNREEDPKWIVEAIENGIIDIKINDPPIMFINTPKGVMMVKPGDYIIKGIAGKLYSRRKDIFEETYEAVAE